LIVRCLIAFDLDLLHQQTPSRVTKIEYLHVSTYFYM
jgi:hypothetical protein